MKIYPNKMSIKIKDNIDSNNDIQLAYVDTTSSVYNVETKIEDKYKIAETKEVLPYDSVNTNICLFTKNGELIPYDSMIQDFVKDGNDYIYMPKSNSTKFIPRTFEYFIKAKKNIQYQSNMIYNIKTLSKNKTISHLLMQIFGDAKDRSLAPNNVLINNGDLSLDKINNMDINDSDITFFLFKNLETIISDDNKNITFNKKYYLEEFNTTMFCIIQNDSAIKDYEGIEYNSEKVNLFMANENYKYDIATKNIYSDSINTRYYFNIPPNTPFTKYSSIFSNTLRTPILIENNIGINTIVYITEEIINDVKKYYKAIYEAMIHMYLNGYKKSDIYTSWISDFMPDYIVENSKLLKKVKHVSQLTPSEMLNIPSNSYSNLVVNIDSDKFPYVKYDGLYNNYLSFIKNKGEKNEYADPKIKPDKWISVYCNDEIFFYQEFIYRINDNLEDCINVQINSEEVLININKFRHSNSGIYIKNTLDPLSISLINDSNGNKEKISNATYYLIYNSLMQFELVKYDNYKEGLILITINISKDISQTEKTVFDMRKRGGGLPKSEKDNFDCFDIGNIYGRQYRKGGALIITLPKYLEEYKDLVMNIVKQYMLADDYPIIIFEEEK